MDTGLYGAEPANSQPVDLSISGAARALSAPATLSPLAAAIEDWEEAGFGPDVLPVMPPDAIVENDKLRAKRGKIPGRYIGGGRWVGFARWTQHEVTPEDRAEWRTWPGAGLCVRNVALTAFDIDVDNTPLAAEMEAYVLKEIGSGALVRKRGNSPRVAILVQQSTGPARRKRAEFTLPNDTRPHAVELLCDGQQTVVAGKHPSGSFYETTAHGLDDWTMEDIPCLSAEKVADIYRGLGEIALAAGGQIALPKQSSHTGHTGPGVRLDPYNAVMRAACRPRAKWATYLFGCHAGSDDQELRLEPSDLCRDGILEEALCLYPHSIYDHGTERSHTPISLIREFGHVEADGEITFGGPPVYGPKDGRPYAVVGESSSTVRRPTEAEAFAWLVDCLGGPAIPPGGARDVQMACLAASVGLDWAALKAEDATALLCPVDESGKPLPKEDPATWTAAETAECIVRVVALRALHPDEHQRLQKARGLSDEDLAFVLDMEEDRARKWTPPEPATPVLAGLPQVLLDAASSAVAGPAAAAVRPRVVNFRTYTTMPDPKRIPLRDFIIHPRIARGDLVSVIGMPGMSKSAFGLFDCVVITSGEERILRGEGNLSPERLHETGPAIFYDAEDAHLDMERRLTAMMAFYGIPKLRHPLTLISGVGSSPLWIARRNTETRALVEAEGAALLRKWIDETGAVYVVLGPLAGLAEGVDENAAADLNLVAQILTNIGAETDCCINVIHHTSKSGGGEAGDMNAARGSSAFAAKVRGMTTLTALPEAEAKQYGFTGRGYFVATSAKSNHAPRSDGGVIFKRESVLVGNGAGFADDQRGAFEMPARELLRAEGERVQVLRVVGLRTSEPREAVREQKRAAVEDGISAAILDVMGGVGRQPLKDIMSDLVRQFLATGAMRAQASHTVRERLRTLFEGAGKVVAHDGQDVRIRMVKDGPKEKDPWLLIVEPVPEGMSESRSDIP